MLEVVRCGLVGERCNQIRQLGWQREWKLELLFSQFYSGQNDFSLDEVIRCYRHLVYGTGDRTLVKSILTCVCVCVLFC